MKKIHILGSDNLIHWDTVRSEGIIANLQFRGETLSQNKILLHNRPYKYFKIQWGHEDLEINEIISIFTTQTNQYEKELQTSDKITGSKRKKQPNSFYYDLGGYYPIRNIDIHFYENNSIAHFQIFITNQISEDNPSNESWTSVSLPTTIYQL